VSVPGLRPALFLDRDGVLIENRPRYVRSLAEAVLLPGAIAALAEFARSAPDWLIVIVSNQAGIGHGLVSRAVVDEINSWITAQLRAAGGRLDAIYLCPHRPDENCACRKPKPGLLLQAAAELGIDRAASLLVGDSATDVQAALAAGVRPVFVQTGLPERLAAEQAQAEALQATICADLAAALHHLRANGLPRPA
jgi:D-glycero-D-manno-heptose 1,7-bisphosphate phosphatase